MINLYFSPIRHQFVVLMMIMALFLIVGYSVFTFQSEKALHKKEAVEELVTLSRALNNDYAKLIMMGLPSTSLELKYKWASFPMIEHADIDNATGEPILHYSKTDNLHQPIVIENHDGQVTSNQTFLYKRDVVFEDKVLGTVRYVVSNKKYLQLLDTLTERLMVTIAVALAVAIILSWRLQHIFVMPVNNLMSSIREINEKGDYSAKIKVDDQDKSEFGALGNEFNALLHKVDGTLRVVEESEAYAKELAYYDELTKLPNRRLLSERMEYILDIAKREKRYGALLFIDLDHFKTLNDSRGHSAGDELLIQVSTRLKQVFRAEDTIARLGGDEFVILSGHLEPSEEAVANQVHSLMMKLKYVLAETFNVQGESFHLTASVGVTSFPNLATDADELMRQADTAMYRAKEAGRDGYRFYETAMQEEADIRLRMEGALRQAIMDDEFQLYYQPQVDEYGRILGAEALLRWINSDGQFISPADFIPVAEQTGLIIPVGDWVLREGLNQLAEWQRLGIEDDFRLSINISPHQFHQADFVEKINTLLKETGARAEQLTLEVTEGISIVDLDATVEKMNTLTSLGLKISMDDFGTGYSSLTYLKQLPLSELKVDQSFVRDLHIDESDAEIAATVIAMAKSLKLEVVAEGVEEESQLRFLSRNGCKVFQGYYFHKPMPAKNIDELLFENLVVL